MTISPHGNLIASEGQEINVFDWPRCEQTAVLDDQGSSPGKSILILKYYIFILLFINSIFINLFVCLLPISPQHL